MQTRIRPVRVFVAVAIGMLMAYVAIFSYHPVRVWLSNGKWCIRVAPNGSKQVLYGDDCGK